MHYRSVYTIAIGAAAAQAIGFISLPYVTRNVTPSEFGLFSIIISIVAFLKAGTTLRLETEIVPSRTSKFADLAAASTLLVASGTTTFVLCFGLMILVLQGMLAPGFSDYFNIATISTVYLLSFCQAATLTFDNYMNYKSEYGRLAIAKFVMPVSFILFFLIFNSHEAENKLLFSQIFAALASCLAIASLARIRRMHVHRTALHLGLLWRFICDRLVKTKYLVAGSLIDAAGLQMPVALVGYLFGLAASGEFSLSWRALLVPSGMLGAAVSVVFFKTFSTAAVGSKERIKVLSAVLKRLAILGFLPTVAVSYKAPELFELVFGHEWQGAGELARVIVWIAYIMFISSPCSNAIIVLGMQKVALKIAMVTLLYRISAIFFGYYIGSLMAGIYVWLVAEFIAIIVYNFLIFKKCYE